MWRYESMKCYDNLRKEFLRLSPVGERVFQLRLGELRQLDRGESLSAEFWKERKKMIDEMENVDLPHTFKRFSPLSRRDDESSHRWQGIGLSRGRVEGRAWVLSQPQSELPAELQNDKIVLVARTVDAGWISTFRLVDAVAVELGGDLSHGSIILRELGFPAITSASGVWTNLKTGDRVILDAERGALERVSLDVSSDN
jgi:pyruvate,water dikinase